ncbi:MAG: flavodoxin family protein [Bacillota bacterium]
MGYLLAVSSSPRREGNSELLLKSFTEGAQKAGQRVETVRLNELNYRPCQACDRCATTGRCVLKDDMQRLYPLVESAGGIVLATPVYFGSLSAQLKMLIDRFQCWWHAKYRLEKPFVRPEENRPGYIICTGALQKAEFCESAVAIIKVFYRNINYQHSGTLCRRGYDQKGSIKDDPVNLENAYQAGLSFGSKDMPR